MDELELVEVSAYRTSFEAAPPAVARELGMAIIDVDGGIAVSIAALPQSRLFNRVIGVEDTAPLEELEQWYVARGCSFAVTLVADSPLEPVLADRGYRLGRSAMKFRRDAGDPPDAPTALDIRPIDRSRADGFGELTAVVYGMPPELGRWFACLPVAPGWTCFGAYDGGRLVGGGSLHVAHSLGWLGIAATDPAARGRGAQSAVLAARIRVAAAAGAATLAVETPEPPEGELPGPSYRNILRAGFRPAYRQQLWLPPD